MYVCQRRLIRPKFIIMGDGVIDLGDSLAPVPWHLRANLGTEDHYCTSVLVYPRQRERLRVLKRCCEEHIISSVACREDTRDVNKRPRKKVLATVRKFPLEDQIRGATSYAIV